MAGAKTMNKGTLYGIGVGPGDPELITVKAVRLIQSCPVIAYPADGNGESLARSIASHCILGHSAHLPIAVPMMTDRAPAREAYDAGAKQISLKLESGSDVAFLCQGDPLFYASFMYLYARMSQNYRVQVIPGVTSLTACAAALGRPLAARNEVLKILPATLSIERLREELAKTEAAAIIKVGRHFDKIRKLLTELDLASCAAIIESATSEKQKISTLNDIPDGGRPYFSTILIYKGEEGW
jgi:precorrin-2/cobalt-factor-2 C20-methyltransferase